MKTTAERQLDFKQRRKQQGLKRVEFWLTSSQLEQVKEFIKKIKQQ